MEDKFLAAFTEALEIEDHEVRFEDSFKEYPEWDSLNRLTLIAMLDENYEIQIENETFNQLKTVGQILEYIN